MEWYGEMGHGKLWRFWRVKVRHGTAWSGKAVEDGEAGRGEDWSGKAVKVGCGMVCRGRVGCGGRGSVRFGRVGYGQSRRSGYGTAC